MTQTAELIKDPVQDLARILEGYEKGKGGINSHYARAIAQTAVPIRDMYTGMAEAEGIHKFFNELPNLSELSAYTNYLLATNESSDISTRKYAESGRMAFAVKCLANYVETATRRQAKEDVELRDNLYWLQAVDEFFETGEFRQSDLRIGYDLTHDKECNAVNAAKMVGGYLRAVEFVYGKDEVNAKALEELKGRAHVMGKQIYELCKKDREKTLKKSEVTTFYDNVMGLKNMITVYALAEHKRKNLIVQRDLRKEMGTEDRRDALTSLDAKVTEHLESTDIAGRAGNVFELLRKTWPYMQRSYNPEDFDIDNINFSHLLGREACDYQRELGYILITNSGKYEEFKGFFGELNSKVRKRVEKGEKREAAALSELVRALGSTDPEKDYSSRFAWAGLFPIEKIGTYETSDIVAEALGIDAHSVEEKLKQYTKPESNGFWNTLSRVGKFFTRKIF